MLAADDDPVADPWDTARARFDVASAPMLMAVVAGRVGALHNRPITVYRFPCGELTLLCATLCGHLTWCPLSRAER